MEEYDSILTEFLDKIKSLNLTIILVGSCVTGHMTKESDIDLILIAKDSEMVKQIRKRIPIHSSSSDRILLDCKVYTEDEFTKARTGSDNFFLWNALQNSKVLSGSDSWTKVSLVPSKAATILWTCITDLENACNMLEMEVQFTGCCFKIFNSLKTIFFAEGRLLDTEMESKNTYLQKILEGQYKITYNRYKWVMQHVKDHSAKKMNIPSKTDRRYRKTDYSKMYNTCVKVLNFAREKVAELSRIIEIL